MKFTLAKVTVARAAHPALDRERGRPAFALFVGSGLSLAGPISNRL